jgi:hypothetical protein
LIDPLLRGRGSADAGGSRARRRPLPRWLRWRGRCRGRARHGRRSSSQRATAALLPFVRSACSPTWSRNDRSRNRGECEREWQLGWMKLPHAHGRVVGA